MFWYAQCTLQWEEEAKPNRVVICSDSYAMLRSLQTFNSRSRQDLLYEILLTYGGVRQMGIQARFTGVTAHVGVEGHGLLYEILLTHGRVRQGR